MLLIRELADIGLQPAVPRRIVQKLLADVQARRIALLERATDVRDVSDSRLRTFAVGERLWATFARCAARGQLSRPRNAT